MYGHTPQMAHNYEKAGRWRLEQSFGNTSQILESRGLGVDMYMRGLLRDPPNMVMSMTMTTKTTMTATTTMAVMTMSMMMLNCLLVGCLTCQQHASVSQGRICSDKFICCHTEIDVQVHTDTGPISPSADLITPGAWQGSYWSANF